MSVYDKLQALNITLPPVAVPAATYVPFVQTGNLVFLSGHIAKQDGKVAPHWLAPKRAGPQRQKCKQGTGGIYSAGHHARQAGVEGQAQHTPKRHGQVNDHRHPTRWHVHEDDAVALALLKVARRNRKAQPHTRQHQRRGQRGKPRPRLARQTIKGLRRSVVKPIDIFHSNAIRKAAAHANGLKKAAGNNMAIKIEKCA